MGRTTRIGCAVMVLVGVFSLAVTTEVLHADLLTNPGFESGLTGWTLAGFGGTKSSSPDPYGGSAYFAPTSTANTAIFQEVDLAPLGYDAHRLATGGYRVRVQGWQYTAPPFSLGQITLSQKTSSGSANGSTSLPAYATPTWGLSQQYAQIAPGTTKLIYSFQAISTNTLYLNSVLLTMPAWRSPSIASGRTATHQPPRSVGTVGPPAAISPSAIRVLARSTRRSAGR